MMLMSIGLLSSPHRRALTTSSRPASSSYRIARLITTRFLPFLLPLLALRTAPRDLRGVASLGHRIFSHMVRNESREDSDYGSEWDEEIERELAGLGDAMDVDGSGG